MANDFKFGSKAITDLYLGNKAVLQVYFGSKLIWEKASKVLLAQNDDVAIEYVPSTNEEIEHISCFFNPTNDNAEIRFKIFHESGLIVAQVTADSIDSQVTELYGLQGQKRTVTLNPKLTLRAGEKYYIQYTCSDSGTRIKPAYLQNKTGNYKSSCRVTDSKSVASIDSLGNYLDYVTDIGEFITASNTDFMVWTGNSDTDLTAGRVYVRNSTSGTAYYGDLGNGHYSGQDSEAIYYMSLGEIFRWAGYNNEGDGRLEQYRYYKRIYDATLKPPTDFINLNNYSNNNQKMAAVILGASKKNTAENTAGARFTGDIWNWGILFNNYIYTLNSGYSVHFSSVDSFETDPETYQDDTFYYMIHNNTEGLWVCKNGTLVQINQYNGTGQSDEFIENYISQVDALNAIERVGQGHITEFISSEYTDSYYSNTFRNATLETTEKFYLEIDGREV